MDDGCGRRARGRHRAVHRRVRVRVARSAPHGLGDRHARGRRDRRVVGSGHEHGSGGRGTTDHRSSCRASTGDRLVDRHPSRIDGVRSRPRTNAHSGTGCLGSRGDVDPGPGRRVVLSAPRSRMGCGHRVGSAGLITVDQRSATRRRPAGASLPDRRLPRDHQHRFRRRQRADPHRFRADRRIAPGADVVVSRPAAVGRCRADDR